MFTCSGAQHWTVNSDGTITEVASGLCLSVSGGATSSGALADIYTCNGSSSESWTVNSG